MQNLFSRQNINFYRQLRQAICVKDNSRQSRVYDRSLFHHLIPAFSPGKGVGFVMYPKSKCQYPRL
jgi:hypothetical protein